MAILRLRFLHWFLFLILFNLAGCSTNSLQTSRGVLPNKVLVYRDEGVDLQSLEDTIQFFRDNIDLARYSVATISSHELIHTQWEASTKLLVFPGGRDIPYDRALRGKGCEKIREYIREGGHYLGICAGAYFAGERVEFAPGTELEVIEDRELGLFPGITSGPVLADYTYNSEAGSRAARLQFLPLQTEFFAYYNGGGTFVSTSEAAEKYEVLATYGDRDDCPAIIRCSFGKGMAILSGVHFECNLKELVKRTDEPQRTMEICHAIKQTEAQKGRVIQRLLEILGF